MPSSQRDPATTRYRYALDADEMHFCDVRILTDRGDVQDYTVLYLAIVNGTFMPVVRFDAAHGYPHRDTLDWGGHVVEKHWTPLESLSAALDNAIIDVKRNYLRYFDEYLLRRPGR